LGAIIAMWVNISEEAARKMVESILPTLEGFVRF
jgi:hypothetical protein